MQQQYFKWFENKQQKTARKHTSAQSNKQYKHKYLI